MASSTSSSVESGSNESQQTTEAEAQLKPENPWDRDWILDSGRILSEARLKFYEDQQKGTGSVLADLSIFCEGGFILAHKMILCPGSKFIRKATAHQDPMCRTAAVAMLQYNVHSVLPVINFIYTGKMVFKWSEFNIMKMVVDKMELELGEINFSRAVRAQSEDRESLQKISFVPLIEYDGIPTSNSNPVRFATVLPTDSA